ncbi:MAG TPA: iron ABC transporter permease [Phototrophicaceae bacterium]|nr:iron ABC transporter permease [Phototrophicaceae bacterium]
MARSLPNPVKSETALQTAVLQTALPPASIRLAPALRPGLLIGLTGLLIAIFLLCLVLGSVNIPLDQIVRVLLGGEADKAAWTNIILKFRLPKAITAVFAGAALSVSGLLMQTFFRNPLADPFTLGINSGASLGVALVVLTIGSVGGTVLAGLGFLNDVSLAVAASIGAGFTMLLMIFTARQVKSTATLLIVGLMFGSLVGALVSLLLFFSIPDRIQAFLNWGFGTFGSVTWSQLVILIPAITVGLILAFLLSKSLNALLSGEAYARSMGLNVPLTRTLVILATGILSGTVTAFCGPIGFLGIAVPHLCRGLFHTSDHRILTPAVMLVGATAALIAVLIAEVPGSSLVLPVNAITALMGAPVVIHVILRQQRG